nr:hypothetical protein [Spiroplasma phoeniceum]
MTVNGQPVEVINNKFVYNMKDQHVTEGKDGTNIYGSKKSDCINYLRVFIIFKKLWNK